MLTSADKVGGSKKGQKHADVILEWFLALPTLGQLWFIHQKRAKEHN
jgi:hypothetical protein